MDGYISVSREGAGGAKAIGDFLNCGFVDEVLEAKSIWITELKLIVIGEEAEQEERLEDSRVCWRFLDMLQDVRIDFRARPANQMSIRHDDSFTRHLAAVVRHGSRSLVGFLHGERTFISAGKRSLCVKYETRLVCHAPETRDSATSIAPSRISTEKEFQCMDASQDHRNIQDRPVRKVFSIALAKSKKTASTLSSPASTVMMSALGLVNLLANTAPRKTVKV